MRRDRDVCKIARELLAGGHTTRFILMELDGVECDVEVVILRTKDQAGVETIMESARGQYYPPFEALH